MPGTWYSHDFINCQNPKSKISFDDEKNGEVSSTVQKTRLSYDTRSVPLLQSYVALSIKSPALWRLPWLNFIG